MVVVSLVAASICFMGSCYPALVGDNTPTGTFLLSQQRLLDSGYGGDVLVYHENRKYIWAIHRVYTLNPHEHRVERLHSNQAAQRRSITNGCINIMPEVYQKLVDCCSKDVLVIS